MPCPYDCLMNYDGDHWTFDCEPTLTDSQVVEFCREGHLLLRGVVPDEINRRTCDYLESKVKMNPSWIPEGMTNEDLERIRTTHAPSTILLENWFVDHVLLNAPVSGAIRSLLGRDVGLPVIVSDHRCECPQEAQRWHHAADHVFGPELNFVEVFYFPQDTPIELGPSEMAPSTHIRNSLDNPPQSGVLSDGPAGTVGIHHQSILHRRSRSTAEGTRHMLKYSYWPTVPPQRDWVLEPRFNPHSANYGGHNLARYVAHIYAWLSGKPEGVNLIGGQGWPSWNVNDIAPRYGFEARGGYLPAWRSKSPDGYA